MYFTLEALQAHHGDSLLLHWGSKSDPRLAIIDGGPDPTYRTVLRPRLEALTAARGRALAIDLLMISHIDDDHINGVQDLLKDVDSGKLPSVEIQRLWFNSFDDLAASDSGFVAASTRNSAATLTRLGRIGARSRPVVTSVKQGRSVATLAARLGLAGNQPFRGLVQAPARRRRTVRIDSHLELTIIGPNQTRLDQLQEDWVATEAGARKSSAALAYLDDSIANLSSIVVLARSGTKTMLLTGDARGDDILAGLCSAGLLKNRMKVHLFKLPHHGSDRNVD
nr:MBL fold metallo-hydrolase [Actinomycetota bacterium]